MRIRVDKPVTSTSGEPNLAGWRDLGMNRHGKHCFFELVDDPKITRGILVQILFTDPKKKLLERYPMYQFSQILDAPYDKYANIATDKKDSSYDLTSQQWQAMAKHVQAVIDELKKNQEK